MCLALLVPTDPCDFSLCSHPLHSCKVVNGMATCVCRQICPLILLPVCGSDGQSYPNNCSLEVEACMTGKDLTVVSMGECGNYIVQWNPAIRPPRYYNYFFVARTKAHSFSYLKTPLICMTTPLLRPTTTFWSPQSLFSL